MTARKFTIGSKFEIFVTTHERREGYVAQDIIVIDLATHEITGKFCDLLKATQEAEDGLQNVVSYYWVEAQQEKPGCSVKEIDPAI